MSKIITFCLGIAGGLGVSQNFNHKVIWGSTMLNPKTNIIFSISRPESLKNSDEIYDDIINKY